MAVYAHADHPRACPMIYPRPLSGKKLVTSSFPANLANIHFPAHAVTLKAMIKVDPLLHARNPPDATASGTHGANWWCMLPPLNHSKQAGSKA